MPTKQSDGVQASGGEQAGEVRYSINENLARNRVKVFEFLANIFNQRPDESMVQTLRSSSQELLEELRSAYGENRDVQQGLDRLEMFIGEVNQQETAETVTSLLVDWTTLFRGLGPGYGPIPPYEALFLDQTNQEVDLLHSIAQRYLDFGLAPSGEVKNRHDFLGIELDFLRYLSQKEADAWQTGEEDKAIQFAASASSFFMEHLKGWAPRFCDQAGEFAKTDFYAGMLHIVKGSLLDLQDEYSMQ